MELVRAASSGTSDLPDLLADAGTSETMKASLARLAEKPELARELAKQLLAGKTPDDVAAAFSKLSETLAADGVNDPEELLLLKLDALVSQYVDKAELAVSGIKKDYRQAANAATTLDALNNALSSAADAANRLLGEI